MATQRRFRLKDSLYALEEPNLGDDALAPARGLINAIALSIPLWIVVGTTVYLRWWS